MLWCDPTMKCSNGTERTGLMNDDGGAVHKLAIAHANLPPHESERRWWLLDIAAVRLTHRNTSVAVSKVFTMAVENGTHFRNQTRISALTKGVFPE